MLRARTLAGLVLLGLAAACAIIAYGETQGASRDVEGTIVFAHQDGARGASSRYVPVLHTGSGPVALRLPGGVPVAPGTRVLVRGAAYADGAIVGGRLARLGPPTTVGSMTIGPANFTPGPRKVLVLVAQIPGQPPIGSVDAIRNIIFTAPNSANAYIQQESFGQLSLTGAMRADGDVYGPYTLVPKSPNACDAVTWGKQIQDSFNAATGLNSDKWDNVIFVFRAPVCDFSGEAEIGQIDSTRARYSWINPALSDGVPTTSVVAHELGHNFGVDHAGGFNCSSGSSRISFSESCATSETTSMTLPDQYLDPLDVMGTGIREESAYHRWESGWLPPSSAETIVRNGTYLLAPVERSSDGVQLYEVPRGAGKPSYWLDFRQPLDGYFDTFSASDPAVNGVTIRYANSSAMFHPAKSWLIDTTPDTSTFDDAPLGVGRTYTDGGPGVSISTISVSPLGALVRVSLPNGADATPPAAATGLTAAAANGSLVLNWTAAADDSGPVQHYLVRRNGTQAADLYDTTWTDPNPAAGRTTSYDVTSIDPAGNVGRTATIEVSIGDTSPPSAPSGLVAGVSGSGVNLAWGPAADDIGVASYEVYRDGQPIARGVQATSLSDPNAGAGTHTYAVRAVDAAGNFGAFATVAVVVVAPAAVVVTPPPAARLKTVTALTLRRLGKHRVLVSWKAQKGANRYQVLRATGKQGTLLATIKKVQYVDGHAPTGKLVKSRYVVRAVLN